MKAAFEAARLKQANIFIEHQIDVVAGMERYPLCTGSGAFKPRRIEDVIQIEQGGSNE